MLDLRPFQNLALAGGFLLVKVRLTAEPLLDPLRREATAMTIIRGTHFHISIRADLDGPELSISLYHEILEAATVAAEIAPPAVVEFNEGNFEAAAREAHAIFGPASPETLNRLLAEFGFSR